MLNHDFLKLILAGRKRLIPLKDVKWVVVPKFEELAVDKMMKLMEKDADFMSYFPDKLPKGRTASRDYFWNILNTTNELYVQKLVSHANRQRYTADNEERKDEAIEVSEEWAELLTQHPFVSCKYLLVLILVESKGKMIHLLKKGSKPVRTEYKRRIVPLAITYADFKKEQQQFQMPASDKADASKAKKEEAPKAAPATQQQTKPATKNKVADGSVQAQQMNHPGTQNVPMDDGYTDVTDKL